MLSYRERAKHCQNPTAKRLLNLMEAKQTNLACALDVTRAEELLALAEKLGPQICVLKTHIDIIEDFDSSLVKALTRLAEQHEFLIFEDRKFADIGNTVKLQYSKGVYHISDWAAITNAHSVSGPGIIEGLKAVGLARGNGLLLLAEMSSKGGLFTESYTQATIEMARQHPDFVIGFVCQHRLVDEPQWIYFTPGVSLHSKGDDLGQQYNTPVLAIGERGVDVIIVGRGIYQAEDPVQAAREYRRRKMYPR